MRLALATVLCLVGLPAAAQGLADQYAGAVRAFTLPTVPGFTTGALMEEDAIEALLPSLEGNWAPVLILFGDPANFGDELLVETCERVPMTLVPTALRSFEFRRSTERDGRTLTLAIRHDFLIGTTFDRSVDEAQALAFFNLEQQEPAVGMLHFSGMRGEVSMFHPSPDILVFVAEGAPPEILARCP